MIPTVATIVVLYQGHIVSWKAIRTIVPMDESDLNFKYHMDLPYKDLAFKASPLFSGPDPFEEARIWRRQFPEHPHYMRDQFTAH